LPAERIIPGFLPGSSGARGAIASVLWRVEMRANEVFSWLGPDRTQQLLKEMLDQTPGAAAVALGAAAEAFRLRPQFLRRQPIEKRAEWVRRALARPSSAAAAEQVLAEYFLAAHRPLLVELLDALEVKHDDAELEDPSPPCPDPKKLRKVVTSFRKGEDPESREFLLRAFAAQSAIDWPPLEELLEKKK
jgi:hypothetical protein